MGRAEGRGHVLGLRISVPEPPALDIQEDLFKMGLTASNIWYGSSQSTVWTGS